MTSPEVHRKHNPRPILNGILPFDPANLPRDVIAGATLAALGIPEVMGYTKIAGTPVVTGLYTILLPIAVFAIFGSSRHLVVGADSATAAVLAAGLGGLAAAGSPAYVGMASLLALHVRRAPHRGAAAATRIHRQLPVPQRADRVPDRRRDPGRDGPGRRDVRRAGPDGGHAREVRPDAPGDSRPHERGDAGGRRAGARHDRGPRAGQPEDPGRPHRRRRRHRAELRPRPRPVRGGRARDRPGRPARLRPPTGHRRRLDARDAAADGGLPGRHHPRPERRDVPGLRDAVPGQLRRERRPRGPRPRERRCQPDRHVRRQRQPDQDRDGRQRRRPQPDRGARDGRDRARRPGVPDRPARLHARGGAGRRRVPHRAQADRLPGHGRHREAPPGRVRRGGGHHGDGRRRGRRAGHHPRDGRLDRRAHLSQLPPVRPDLVPAPAATTSRSRSTPPPRRCPGWPSTGSARASTTRTRHASRQRSSTSSSWPSPRFGGSACRRPRSGTSTTRGRRRWSSSRRSSPAWASRS